MHGTEALRHAAGQVLLGGFEGLDPDPAFAALIRGGQVGGAILFRRNIEGPHQAQDLLRRLSGLPAPEPLMYAVDQEGGRVQRLRSPFPELPEARVFGQAGRKSLAHRAGGLLARALRAVGFHQNYAPVLDVDSNPDNPVIGDRAFSQDPNAVARLGAAFIDGLQSAGVAACGKHFPGHGDTTEDSHLALPRLDHTRARLEAIELVPFRAAVHADVAAIMTAHIVFADLDPEHPATLSEAVLGPLLRDGLGYRGVVVSDDLEMRAVADHYGIEEAAVRAIRAGCDQLLICRHPELIARAHEALVKAVESGQLSRARLMEAAERVRDLKRTYDVSAPPSEDLDRALADPEAEALWAELEASSGGAAGPDPTEYGREGPAWVADAGLEGFREVELDEGDPAEVLELDLG
jgi:beta-N-acetylhexosaminidase